MEVSGTIVNKTNHRQAFNLQVDFLDDSDVKLASDSLVYVSSLDANGKGKWSATGFATGTAPESIKCKVSQVNYWGS